MIAAASVDFAFLRATANNATENRRTSGAVQNPNRLTRKNTCASARTIVGESHFPSTCGRHSTHRHAYSAFASSNLNGAFGRLARSRSLRNRFAARRTQILKRAPFVSATADSAYAIARRTNADSFLRISLKRFFGRPPRGVDRGVSSLRFAFSVFRYARAPRRPASDNAFDVVAPIRFGVFFGVFMVDLPAQNLADRKSTRLNSSHVKISYAVFCL